MAVDYFLKFDGVDGESQDAKHKGEIEVESFSWGLSQTGTLAGGGGAGKVQFQDFHFNTSVSKASPKLMLACATGEHIKSATLTCRKAGGQQQDFMHIKMSDVLISSYQSAGSAGVVTPSDSVAINFAKIEFDYAAQRPDGSLDAPVKAGWDLKANKKV